MKQLGFFIVFIIFVTVLPSKLDSRALPRPSKNARLIHNYNKSPLQMRERNEKREKFENLMVRKSNMHNIPVYLITRSKPNKRTSKKYDHLFDSNGMIYLSNPKKREYNYEDGRRTDWRTNKNMRKLMAIMNKELNQKLLAKTTNVTPDVVINFNDLVV